VVKADAARASGPANQPHYHPEGSRTRALTTAHQSTYEPRPEGARDKDTKDNQIFIRRKLAPCRRGRQREIHRSRTSLETRPQQRPRHGPCRNRTYNLAIKSRLLCQLS
jgi:hypothetical protein